MNTNSKEEKVPEATGRVVDERKGPSAGQTASDVYAGQSVGMTAETSSAAVAAKAKALVEARYIVAMRQPRDHETVRVRVLAACARPAFAAVARYLKPVGDGVYGPSIRFAEEAMRCMGNAVADVSLVFEDSLKRVFNVTVTDLEANTPWSTDVTVEKSVERKYLKQGQRLLNTRVNSHGDPLYIVEASDDEMLNKQNALISKALRTLILRIVPGDITEEAMALVIKTQLDEDAKDPDASRKNLVYSFSLRGIHPKDLREYLGHEIAQATATELAELRAIGIAIANGEATWSEAIEHKRGGSPAQANGEGSSLRDKVAAKAKEAKGATPPPDSKPKAAEAKPEVKPEPAKKADGIDPDEQAEAERHFQAEEAKRNTEKPK